jgi:hypothetical protein
MTPSVAREGPALGDEDSPVDDATSFLGGDRGVVRIVPAALEALDVVGRRIISCEEELLYRAGAGATNKPISSGENALGLLRPMEPKSHKKTMWIVTEIRTHERRGADCICVYAAVSVE